MLRLMIAAVFLLVTTEHLLADELIDATKAQDVQAVQRLLDGGAKVDVPGPNQETALTIAALEGRLDIAELLVAHGADIRARNVGGFTPLHAAAYSGSAPIATLLLDKGAALEDTDNKAHASPLMVAADEGRLEVVELLLDRGADLNTLDKDGWSPLSQAWSKKHIDVVRLLKQHGAKCQSTDVLGGDGYYQQCVASGE